MVPLNRTCEKTTTPLKHQMFFIHSFIQKMKMPPKKPNPQLPAAAAKKKNGGGSSQGKRRVVNGGKSFQRKSIEPDGDHHWDFLEEIDAPMWVDLTLESKTMNQDLDDSWFHVAHPFHQCSFRELISTLSVSDEGKANSSSELLGPPSPKLPTSVSKSRGKNYRCRKWRGDVMSVNKQHPIKILGRKTVRVEVKPKDSVGNPKRNSSLKTRIVRETRSKQPNSLQNKPSCRSTNCNSRSKTSFVCESSSADTKEPDVIRTNISYGDSESTSSLNAGFLCESNSSTASSNVPDFPKCKFSFGDWRSSSNSNANNVGQKNQPETVTDQIFGRKSGLLSAVRLSLRKSVVSRQASRVEIKDAGHKSSSTKSSGGSSSNSSYNQNNTLLTGKVEIKKTVLETKKVVRIAQSTKGNNSKGKNVRKTSNGSFLDPNSNSKGEGDAIVVKSVRQETSKSKVLYQSEPRKSLRLRNLQGASTESLRLRNLQVASTVGLKAKKNVAGNNKVNPLGRLVSQQIAGGKENTLGSMHQTQKASKHVSEESELKDGKELLDPKESFSVSNVIESQKCFQKCDVFNLASAMFVSSLKSDQWWVTLRLKLKLMEEKKEKIRRMRFRRFTFDRR